MNTFLTLDKSVAGTPSAIESALSFIIGVKGVGRGLSRPADKSLRDDKGDKRDSTLPNEIGRLADALGEAAGASKVSVTARGLQAHKSNGIMLTVSKSVAEIAATLEAEHADNVSAMTEWNHATHRRHIQMLEVFRDIRDELEGMHRASDEGSGLLSTLGGALKAGGAALASIAGVLGVKKALTWVRGGTTPTVVGKGEEGKVKPTEPSERTPRGADTADGRKGQETYDRTARTSETPEARPKPKTAETPEVRARETPEIRATAEAPELRAHETPVTSWWDRVRGQASSVWERMPSFADTALDSIKGNKPNTPQWMKDMQTGRTPTSAFDTTAKPPTPKAPKLTVTPETRPPAPIEVKPTVPKPTGGLRAFAGGALSATGGALSAYDFAAAAGNEAFRGGSDAAVVGHGIGGVAGGIVGITELPAMGANFAGRQLNNWGGFGTDWKTDHQLGWGKAAEEWTAGKATAALSSAGLGQFNTAANFLMDQEAKTAIENLGIRFINSELQRTAAQSGSPSFDSKSFAELIKVFNSPAFGMKLPAKVVDGVVKTELMTPAEYMKSVGMEGMLEYRYWQPIIDRETVSQSQRSFNERRERASSAMRIVNGNPDFTAQSVMPGFGNPETFKPPVGLATGSPQVGSKAISDFLNSTPPVSGGTLSGGAGDAAVSGGAGSDRLLGTPPKVPTTPAKMETGAAGVGDAVFTAVSTLYNMATGIAGISDSFIVQKFRETILKKREAAADEATFWSKMLKGEIPGFLGAGGGAVTPGVYGEGGTGVSGVHNRAAMGPGNYVPTISGQDSGLSENYYKTLAYVESGNNPDAVSSTGATGLYQFTRGTGERYGLVGDGFDNRRDPVKSGEAVKALTQDNIKGLRERGIPVNDLNAYLSHQLGIGGFSATYKAMTGQGTLSESNIKAMDLNTTSEFRSQYGSMRNAVSQLGQSGAAAAYYRAWDKHWQSKAARAPGVNRSSATAGPSSSSLSSPISASMSPYAERETGETPGTPILPGVGAPTPEATGSGSLPGFTTSHKGVDVAHLTPATQSAAIAMQTAFGGPLTLNSAYRSPEYNKQVGGATNSMHTQGKAIDVSTQGMSPETKARLLKSALQSGFTSVGFYPNFLHFDTRSGGTTWGTQPEWAKPIMSSSWRSGMTSGASEGSTGATSVPSSAMGNSVGAGESGTSGDVSADSMAQVLSVGAAIAGTGPSNLFGPRNRASTTGATGASAASSTSASTPSSASASTPSAAAKPSTAQGSGSRAFSNGGTPAPMPVAQIQDTPESMARTAAPPATGDTYVNGAPGGAAIGSRSRRGGDVDSIMTSVEDLGLIAVLTQGVHV